MGYDIWAHAGRWSHQRSCIIQNRLSADTLVATQPPVHVYGSYQQARIRVANA